MNGYILRDNFLKDKVVINSQGVNVALEVAEQANHKYRSSECNDT